MCVYFSHKNTNIRFKAAGSPAAILCAQDMPRPCSAMIKHFTAINDALNWMHNNIITGLTELLSTGLVQQVSDAKKLTTKLGNRENK